MYLWNNLFVIAILCTIDVNYLNRGNIRVIDYMSTVATHVMFNLIEIGETRVTSGNKRDASINQTPIVNIRPTGGG